MADLLEKEEQDHLLGYIPGDFYSPRCHGVKWFEPDCDSGISWGIYDPSVPDEFILTRYYPFTGGPGRPYAHTAIITKTKTRKLVRQAFGWDV